MWIFRLKMQLLLAVMFGLLFAAIAVIGRALGVGSMYTYLAMALAGIFFQYLIGPKMVEWSMRVRYMSRAEHPDLYRMVESLSMAAGIPMPRVCISDIELPNAFAFGSTRQGRVCVTKGLMRLLNEHELRAVLGHEISHLKNRDVLTITLLSVIPMFLYMLARHFLWFGNSRDNDQRQSSAVLVGILAFLAYFLANLLVLYASRIREYFADRGAVDLGNKPADLASSLYKLSYGAARLDKESIREVEGLKAFFASDPSQALHEIRDLRQLDLDKDGMIDAGELERITNKTVRLRFGEKLMEALSTHPNMLKRIRQLSEYR
jgi:heat shock protein HtpX